VPETKSRSLQKQSLGLLQEQEATWRYKACHSQSKHHSPQRLSIIVFLPFLPPGQHHQSTTWYKNEQYATKKSTTAVKTTNLCRVTSADKLTASVAPCTVEFTHRAAKTRFVFVLVTVMLIFAYKQTIIPSSIELPCTGNELPSATSQNKTHRYTSDM